jgi:N-methylhydantoinase A
MSKRFCISINAKTVVPIGVGVMCKPHSGEARALFLSVTFNIVDCLQRIMLYVGVDVGGTFTDLVVFDSQTGNIEVIKVPSTPREPESAILNAMEHLRGDASDVALINHATTVATNALLSRTGLAKAALVTNEGFRDVLEIGRQRRSEIYNLDYQRPAPLIRRAHRFTVRGRILADGSEYEPLSEKDVGEVSLKIVKGGFESVAVCLLNSYVNPVHESRVKEVLQEKFSGHISVSSEVDRGYREYERMSTTVVNAVLAPLVSTYLLKLEAKISEAGFRAPLYIMCSDGGMNNASYSSRRPISIIESGPAAGLLASKYLCDALSLKNSITFDMGGTTAKAGTIIDGEPSVAYEFEAAGKTHSGRSIKGSGYTVRYPFMDLAEVSAGGGTIAWVDAGLALRVGPRSAGADPGPAAYGQGGSEPTVTDANIVLGRINPNYLLAGKMPVHSGLARAAIKEKVADKLDLNVKAAAEGVIRLINDSMAKAISIVSVERGRDPRDYSLIAFGGAGPIHGCDLAEEMGISHVVVPQHPGLFSAYGLLTVDVSRTFSAPVLSTTFDAEPYFEALKEEATRSMHEDGFHDFLFQEYVDLRYKGQSYEITLPYRKGQDLKTLFDAAHKALYGYSTSDAVEMVNAKLKVFSRTPKPDIRAREFKQEPAKEYAKREAWISNQDVLSAVYIRENLQPGTFGSGPCIIEEYDSTTVVNKGWSWTVDKFGNLEVKR